jgi:hypothetical protein
VALYQRICEWKHRSPFGEDGEDGVDDDEAQDNIESYALPLPSNLALGHHENATQPSGIEKQLRVGQSHDALKQLRSALALKLALVRNKGRYARGQNENTRAWAGIKQAEESIQVVASRYRAAYHALTKLGIDDVQEGLQPLNDHDLKTANVFEQDRPLGRGFDAQDVSWIWKVRNTGVELEDDNWLLEGVCFLMLRQLTDRFSVMRVQFLDVKTTLDRWKEEVQILETELIRTAQYFRWKSMVWHERARFTVEPGERAHAYLMVFTFTRLAERVPQLAL